MLVLLLLESYLLQPGGTVMGSRVMESEVVVPGDLPLTVCHMSPDAFLV